ncbi:MAG: hypothetical protein WCP21_24110 [Armatimonadota bacterium]
MNAVFGVVIGITLAEAGFLAGRANEKVMDSYFARGIFFMFAFGGVGVMLARPLADWFDWQPWTLRIVGIICLAVGGTETWILFGHASGLRALVAVVIGVPLYVWQDTISERKEQEREDEK